MKQKMKKTESPELKKEDFTTVRYYFMAFHAEKGFPAGTFVTFQGFFKKIEAVLSFYF